MAKIPITSLLQFIITIWSAQNSNTVFAQRLLTLNDNNFQEIIKRDTVTLVSFQAPWCGHCISMAPELKIAAKNLHELNIEAVIAVMDASLPANKEVLVGHSIDGYPSLVAYKNGISVGNYGGPRTARDIIGFLKKKVGAAFVPISSIAELMVFNNEVDAENNLSGGAVAVVLGLFPPGQDDTNLGVYGVASRTLISVTDDLDFVTFLMADNSDLVQRFGVRRDSLLVFTGGASLTPQCVVPIPPHTTTKEMTLQILKHSIPLIINFNKQTQPLIHTLPTKMHILLFYPPIMTPKSDPKTPSGDVAVQPGSESTGDTDPLRAMEAVVMSVAEHFRGRAIFIRIPASESSIRQFFGLPASSHPQIIAADMSDSADLKRFDFSEYISSTTEFSFLDSRTEAGKPHSDAVLARFLTADYVEDFLVRVLDGTFRGAVKSEQEEAEEQSTEIGSNGESIVRNRVTGRKRKSDREKDVAKGTAQNLGSSSIVKVVGSNFRSRVVHNENADSFVFFFAPWCAHCKAFEVVLLALSHALAADNAIQIVRMDATKNDIDHPKIRVNAFPAFYFFPMGGREDPLEYDGERTVEAVLKFILSFRSPTKQRPTRKTPAAKHRNTVQTLSGGRQGGGEAGRQGEKEKEKEEGRGKHTQSGKAARKTAVGGGDTEQWVGPKQKTNEP